MGIPGIIHGFSKLGRKDQVQMLSAFTGEPSGIEDELNLHLLADSERQGIYQGISENTVSNFFLPYSIAPNFRIDDRYYFVPMVTEESSVVAAAAAAAKFWSERGGFRTRILSMNKPGHIHFTWTGSRDEIISFVNRLIPGFHDATSMLTRNMKGRGGGITDIHVNDLSGKLNGYYQIEVIFNTADSMGANFINSCLERMASFLQDQAEVAGLSGKLAVIMSVLSNYTPGCIVECSVNCHTNRLDHSRHGLSGHDFAEKFVLAVNMAGYDVNRAVTHNKGIFNGIDAVLMATGNDFRAVEADGHAYASREGRYRGLTTAEIAGDSFTYRIEIPMNIGTTGGLTRIHPLARVSMKILEDPDAARLMAIASAAGLASNFSAIRALITGGIQHGHMQLHLSNLLQLFGAAPSEKTAAESFFRDHEVSHSAVGEFLADLRAGSQKAVK